MNEKEKRIVYSTFVRASNMILVQYTNVSQAVKSASLSSQTLGIFTLLFNISCRRIYWNLSRCSGFWLSAILNKPMDLHWVLPGVGSRKYYRSLLRMDSLPFPYLDMSNFVPLGFIWPYPPYIHEPYKIRTNLPLIYLVMDRFCFPLRSANLTFPLFT